MSEAYNPWPVGSEYWHIVNEMNEKARQERILRGILRALANDDDRSTEECPMCCGRGRVEILIGAKDDEATE